MRRTLGHLVITLSPQKFIWLQLRKLRVPSGEIPLVNQGPELRRPFSLVCWLSPQRLLVLAVLLASCGSQGSRDQGTFLTFCGITYGGRRLFGEVHWKSSLSSSHMSQSWDYYLCLPLTTWSSVKTNFGLSSHEKIFPKVMWLAPCGIAAPHNLRQEKQRAKTKDFPIPVPLVAENWTPQLSCWSGGSAGIETVQMKCP